MPSESEAHRIIRDLIEIISHADTSEGYCCCGDKIEHHSLGSGHSPVDAGDYYAMQAVDRARAFLEANNATSE